MVEVEILKNEKTLRGVRTSGSVYSPGERAGFDEETAKVLVTAGVGRIVRESVPETAGIGADYLEAECPHCKKTVSIVLGGPKQGRLELAADAKMQPGRGGPRAETRSN